MKVYLENMAAAASSLLTVVAPKFCCWSSAMVAFTSGMSYLAWVHPLKPYLFVCSFVLVGFSFVKIYKKSTNQCEACSYEKSTKRPLWITSISGALVIIIFIINYIL